MQPFKWISSLLSGCNRGVADSPAVSELGVVRFGFFPLPAIDLLFLLWQITLNSPPYKEEETWASAGIKPSLDSNSALHTPLQRLLHSSITQEQVRALQTTIGSFPAFLAGCEFCN